MIHANKLLAQGAGLAPVLVRRAPTVTLDWDTRQKSRFDFTDSTGRHVGVFLARGAVVRGGDVLVAEDGSFIRVIAAEQPVLVVTACPVHGSAFDLTRAAYHLGNRHVPLELKPDRLQIEPDHVLAAMLRHMHLVVTEASAPFEPEAGAYGGHSHHGAPPHPNEHEHSLEDGHVHDRGDPHEHSHDRDHGHGHAHGGGHRH